MVVEMHNVWCSRGSGGSLRGFSLALEAGEIAALLGPAGSGKTTVVELILGWQRPCRGRVRVLGQIPAARGRMIRCQMGVVLDPPGLRPELTVTETLAFHAGLFRLSYPPQAIERLLRRIGLAGRERGRVQGLALEERCMLALARALITSPRLVLLDEPFRYLTGASLACVWDALEAASRAGATILVASRDAEQLAGHARRTIILPAESAGDSACMIPHHLPSPHPA